MIFAPGFRGGPRALTLSFVASAISNAQTIIVPASAAAGDLAILVDYANKSIGAPADVVPAGYTSVIDSSNTNGFPGQRAVVSYRLLGAGEAGASISGMNGNNNNKVVLVFRPSKPIVTVTPGSWSADLTGGDPGARTVTALAVAAPLIVLGMAGANDIGVTFTTASPAFDGTVAVATTGLIAGYKIYNASPANHTIDMGDVGSLAAVTAGYIAVAP